MARRTLRQLLERYDAAKDYLASLLKATPIKKAAVTRAKGQVDFYHKEINNYGINNETITIITYAQPDGRPLQIYYTGLEDKVDIQAIAIRDKVKYGYLLVDYKQVIAGTPYKKA